MSNGKWKEKLWVIWRCHCRENELSSWQWIPISFCIESVSAVARIKRNGCCGHITDCNEITVGRFAMKNTWHESLAAKLRWTSSYVVPQCFSLQNFPSSETIFKLSFQAVQMFTLQSNTSWPESIAKPLKYKCVRCDNFIVSWSEINCLYKFLQFVLSFIVVIVNQLAVSDAQVQNKIYLLMKTVNGTWLAWQTLKSSTVTRSNRVWTN